MSTATLTAGQLIVPGNRIGHDAAPRWLTLGTGLIVGLTFFVAGHDFRVSLAEAYT